METVAPSFLKSTRMARFGARPTPDDRFLTAAKPPARSNTVGSGILMASAKKGERAHDVALSGSIAAHEDRRIVEFDTSRRNTAEALQYELPDKGLHLLSPETARRFDSSFPTPWKVTG